jgi:polyphosphate kinase 2 (PPK2 family)
MRISDPLKRWKLSPMDMESRKHWEEYTKAKEEMLARTHTPDAPWWIVNAVNKRAARLNCISHLLTQIPYQDVPITDVQLPARERHPDYQRHPVPPSMHIPELFK